MFKARKEYFSGVSCPLSTLGPLDGGKCVSWLNYPSSYPGSLSPLPLRRRQPPSPSPPPPPLSSVTQKLNLGQEGRAGARLFSEPAASASVLRLAHAGRSWRMRLGPLGKVRPLDHGPGLGSPRSWESWLWREGCSALAPRPARRGGI